MGEEAENLLNSRSRLLKEEDRKNAGVIVNFVSNVNDELFLEIAERNGYMTEELKIVLFPEIVNLRATIKEQADITENNKKAFAQKELAFA